MDWVITYTNGTRRRENEDGRQTNFDEACRELPVAAIAFAGQREYSLTIPRGATPFARRRHYVVMDAGSGSQTDSVGVHILGWRKARMEKYLFIAPDGTTREADTLEEAQ